MNVDVFYCSYDHDAEWLKWSLRVLRKSLSGYRNIIVVVQDGTPAVFDPIYEEFPDVKFFHEQGWGPAQNYWHQQWVKLCADQYTDADFIIHFDSDAFLRHPVTVEHFLCPITAPSTRDAEPDTLVDYHPCWLWSWYSDLGNTVPWKASTERATKLTCDREFMQGMPFTIRRSTYAIAREHITKEFVQRMAKLGGASFSEFNVLGRFAWEYERDKYHWTDSKREPWPAGFHASRQFWSHAPLEDHLPEIKAMLGEPMPEQAIRCTKNGHWILVNDTHISEWVETHGRLDFDGHLLPRVLPYIKPGMTVVDVGAFIGDHTHAYAKAVIGVDSGRVLAFEPNAWPFEALRRNMQGHGHVECINKGLSSFPGTMSIEQSPNAGASHLVAGGDVEVTTLDSYGLHACDLIKIDAEGLEFSILQGAWQTIARHNPVLVLEINLGALARNGVIPEDIYGWLKLRGYAHIDGVEGGTQFDIIAHK